MSRAERIKYGLLWLLVLTGIGAVVHDTLAQERDVSYPPTKTWEIRMAYGYNITVVDTGGVCLYRWNGQIAAVSKKDLPPGRGCQ